MAATPLSGAHDTREHTSSSLEQAIQESEILWMALNKPGHCNFFCDGRGGIEWASPGVEHTLGYLPESLIGVPIIHLFAGAGKSELAQRLVRPERGLGATTFTIEVHTASGSSLWSEVELLQLTQNGIPLVLVQVRDIGGRVASEEALRGSERRFRNIVSEAPFGLAVQDLDGNLVFMNSRLKQVMGTNSNFMLSDELFEYVHPLDRAALTRLQSSQTSAKETTRLRFVRSEGEIRVCDVRVSPQLDESQHVASHLWAVEDVTAQIRAKEDQARVYSLMEASNDMVAVLDPASVPLYMNPRARTFFGISEETTLTPLGEPLKFEVQTDSTKPPIIERLIEGEIWEGELKLRNSEGKWVPFSTMLVPSRDHDGALAQVSAVLRDISERKRFEERLEWEATHDPLTKLGNRVLLSRRLEAALAAAREGDHFVGVAFLDLDDFRVINESLGHRFGDRLLSQTAERISELIDTGDTLARFGADEFVILMPQLVSAADAEARAEKIRQALSGEVGMAEVELRLTVSAGVGTSDGSDANAATLLRDANSALHESKLRGRDRTTGFTGNLRRKAMGRLNVETGIRRALRQNELRLHYQPQVSLKTGHISGTEALIRWQHPDQGLVGPGGFVSIAEQTGLILPIGSWVLETAFEQAAIWAASLERGNDLTMGINLSGRQLMRDSLIDEIAELIAKYPIAPSMIELEITESILLDDVDRSIWVLDRLKELGVRLSLDDFGTGYSSLTYLQSFPIDTVKIDRSFVDGIGTNRGNAAIVNSVIDLAHTLKLTCIAEGIETQQDLNTLRELGCDYAEGFLMAKPLPKEEAEALISYDPVW